MPDPHDLARFVKAQDHTGTYDDAVRQLRAGRKTRHWMWFVFPQIAGLGYSATSRTYAIASLAEAQAYLQHPILGPRLVKCAGIVAGHGGATAQEIFGETDAAKLRSSMTLFARATPQEQIFHDVLHAYFDGVADRRTEELLRSG